MKRVFLLLSVAALSISAGWVGAQTFYEPYTFTTLAGIAPGTADGTGSAARFYEPSGIGIDSTGNIFVSDTFNDTIRKITPAGVVSTFAGTAAVYGGSDGT